MNETLNVEEDALNYGEGKKEIIFRDTNKRHAELKLQLQYDGLKMAKFLRECVTFYLTKDPLMMELIDKMKGVAKVSIKQTNIVKNERKETNIISNEFALNENEVENIFDMLEEEYPEL